jgi:hypothetical protein
MQQTDPVLDAPNAGIAVGFGARATLREQQVAAISLPVRMRLLDGSVEPFDPIRIEETFRRCFTAIGQTPLTPTAELALRVINVLSAIPQGADQSVSVSDVRKAIELTLQAAGESDAARAYILRHHFHGEEPVPRDERAASVSASTDVTTRNSTDGTRTRRVNVNFSDQAYQTLERLARSTGKSMSDVLREAIALKVWFEETRAQGAHVLVERPNGKVREVISV